MSLLTSKNCMYKVNENEKLHNMTTCHSGTCAIIFTNNRIYFEMSHG